MKELLLDLIAKLGPIREYDLAGHVERLARLKALDVPAATPTQMTAAVGLECFALQNEALICDFGDGWELIPQLPTKPTAAPALLF